MLSWDTLWVRFGYVLEQELACGGVGVIYDGCAETGFGIRDSLICNECVYAANEDVRAANGRGVFSRWIDGFGGVCGGQAVSACAGGAFDAGGGT